MDHGGCGLLVTVENGRITAVKGDPDHPLSRGYICAKGRATADKTGHPDRLTRPLKQAGPRGSGRFVPISWEQALDEISSRMRLIASESGPEHFCFCQGAPKGLEHFVLLRLANTYGSPNVAGPQHVCHMPREMAALATCGFFPVPDYEGRPECVLLWGSQLDVTNEEGIICTRLLNVLDQGARLIVVDPRRTTLAKRADIYLQVRPGADTAAALSMLHTIVSEELHDREFVEAHCTGFGELVRHLEAYPPSATRDATGIDPTRIREAARMYAGGSPALLQWGNGIEHTPNSFQTARSLVLLMALTGNLDAPGGNVQAVPPPTARLGNFVRIQALGKQVERRLSRPRGLLPRFPTVPTQFVVRSILDGDPYRLQGLYIHNTNPLLTWSDTTRVERALQAVELLVVSEIFMTPTAALADYVLPAATQFEFDDIGHYGLPHGVVLARPGIVDPPGEAWPDLKILCALGRTLGLKEHFPEDWHDLLEETLEPSGIDYRRFADQAYILGPREYRKYERKGFSTPTGKVQLSCPHLADSGFEVLPTAWAGPPDGDERERFPLSLTSAKSPYRFHSAGRQLERLRRLEPEPLALLHPVTADRFGLVHDGWAWIETTTGRIKQKVSVTEDLPPNVVCATFGWFDPLRDGSLPAGWQEANLNVLTAEQPWGAELATPLLRPIRCRIKPA